MVNTLFGMDYKEFTKIKKDVERFLEDRTELKFLEFDVIKRTLTTYNK